LDFIHDNNILSYEFYHELQKSHSKSNILLRFFREKFPIESMNLFGMAETFVNMFIKESSDFNSKELLLFIRMCVAYLSEYHQNEYEPIYIEILDKIYKCNMCGIDFTMNTVEQLSTALQYYENGFYKERIALNEIWSFVNSE